MNYQTSISGHLNTSENPVNGTFESEVNTCADAYLFGFNGFERDDEMKGAGNWYSFGDYGYDSRIVQRPSPDPMAAKFPYFSPYAAFGNNPMFFIDPDGRKIRPVNAAADEAVHKKSKKYGQVLRIDHCEEFNVYSAESVFSSYREFRSVLRKSDENFTRQEIKEAWSFFHALRDPDIIEISVLTTAQSSDFTKEYVETQEGSQFTGSNVYTSSPEYNKFTKIFQKNGGNLSKNLADFLYEGKEINNDGETQTIRPDKKGAGWVFFKNIDTDNMLKTGKYQTYSSLKGHLIIDATGKSEDEVSSTMIQSMETLKNE